MDSWKRWAPDRRNGQKAENPKGIEKGRGRRLGAPNGVRGRAVTAAVAQLAAVAATAGVVSEEEGKSRPTESSLIKFHSLLPGPRAGREWR